MSGVRVLHRPDFKEFLLTDGPELGKTSTGVQPHILAGLAYAAGFVSGLIVWLVEKDNRFVRFHALQSIVLALAWTALGLVLQFLPVIGEPLGILVNIGGCVLWIMAVVRAFQGDWYRLPLIGDFAARKAGV